MVSVRELHSKQEIVACLNVMQELYPTLTLDEYERELTEMIQHNYWQVGVFEDEVCIALSGYWMGTKLWCGKYLEIDNLVVANAHRSKGVGSLIIDFLKRKAEENNCTMMSLDSYATNHKAHKLFYNEGFAPLGYHFINILKQEKIR